VDALRSGIRRIFFCLAIALAIALVLGIFMLFDSDQVLPKPVNLALRALLILLCGMALYSLSLRRPGVGNFLRASQISAFIPNLNSLLDENKRRNENRLVVERAKERLRFYRLGEVPNETWNALIDWDSRIRPIEEECANQLAQHLRSKNANLSPEVFSLIYQQQYGNASALWSEKREDLVKGIAGILRRSGRLPGVYKELLEGSVLEQVLFGLAKFDSDDLESKLRELNRGFSYARGLEDFLRRNDLAPSTSETAGELVTSLQKPWKFQETGEPRLDVGSRNLLAWLLEQTQRIVSHYFPQLPGIEWAGIGEGADGKDRPEERVRAALSMVCLLIFLQEFGGPENVMKQVLCQKASQDAAALRVAFAYAEMQEELLHNSELEGKSFVPVRYLAGHWHEVVKNRMIGDRKDQSGRFPQELRSTREDLQRGEWPPRLIPLLRRTFTRVTEELEGFKTLLATIDSSAQLRNSLRGVFHNLRLATIERFLQARSISAYLITFDSNPGELADIIDSLKDGDRRTKSGKPIYVFKHYTRNSRIGVVPQEWTFEAFKERLQNDLGGLLRKVSDDFQMELILHRFGLSGRDHYPLKAECVVAKAMPTLQVLFAEQLKLEDLLAVIGYEQKEVSDRVTLKSVLNFWMSGSIVQVLGAFELTEGEVKQLNDRDREFRKTLNAEMGYASSPALGRAALADAETARKAIDGLGNLLEDETTSGSARSRTIAHAYVNSLKNIANLE
jgi:hypothetical protein